MNTTLTAGIVFGCLIGAVLVGRILRGILPESHLSADSRDVVKLAMGLVATMAALVLGLLVSSAKGSYDTERNEVIQMASKVAFLDRILTLYGSEAANVRAQVRDTVAEAVQRTWPGEAGLPQVRSLLTAQSVPSISTPMLIILVCWLAIIFLGFSVLAPPNATAILALMVSALAVSGAIFLILELDQPFGGLIRISSQPMLNALHQLAK